VYVRQGSNYEPCKDGVAPTADNPCEPGATAVDPDGASPASNEETDSTDSIISSSQGVNKTAEVVVCPPEQCLSRGCSPVELRRHFFAVKGLKGCGIDTSMPEGSQFKVYNMRKKRYASPVVWLCTGLDAQQR
jgi:zinc transporter 1/2/3